VIERTGGREQGGDGKLAGAAQVRRTCARRASQRGSSTSAAAVKDCK